MILPAFDRPLKEEEATGVGEQVMSWCYEEWPVPASVIASKLDRLWEKVSQWVFKALSLFLRLYCCCWEESYCTYFLFSQLASQWESHERKGKTRGGYDTTATTAATVKTFFTVKSSGSGGRRLTFVFDLCSRNLWNFFLNLTRSLHVLRRAIECSGNDIPKDHKKNKAGRSLSLFRLRRRHHILWKILSLSADTQESWDTRRKDWPDCIAWIGRKEAAFTFRGRASIFYISLSQYTSLGFLFSLLHVFPVSKMTG